MVNKTGVRLVVSCIKLVESLSFIESSFEEYPLLIGRLPQAPPKKR